MPSGNIGGSDARRKAPQLGIYAMFSCERRPSDAFIRATDAARLYPLDIGPPKRVIEAARDRKRRP